MKHYYLDKINYDNFDYHLKGDKREKEWRKQRRKYGFDERETWNLNWRFYAWSYERLKMFKKITNINLDFYKFDYKGKTYTQKQMINKMIKRLEYILDFNNEKQSDFEQKFQKYSKEITEIWSLIIPAMWW